MLFLLLEMIPLFSAVFFIKFPLREQKAADHVDPWCTKLQVNLVAEFSVEIVGTQPLACFVEAKRCSKNGMIPLVAELKSRFLKSKLLWTSNKFTMIAERTAQQTCFQYIHAPHISLAIWSVIWWCQFKSIVYVYTKAKRHCDSR